MGGCDDGGGHRRAHASVASFTWLRERENFISGLKGREKKKKKNQRKPKIFGGECCTCWENIKDFCEEAVRKQKQLVVGKAFFFFF